jgi:hypothetical protein
MSRRLDDVRLAVLILDGIELKGLTNVVALGSTTEGQKLPRGLWEGSSENAVVATALLSGLVDARPRVLCVLDGAKALRSAVRDVLGHSTPVHPLRAPQGARRARSPAPSSGAPTPERPPPCRRASSRRSP